MTARSGADFEPVASVVQRLAVLLAAGVAPASAWGYLAEAAGPLAARLRGIVSAIDAGGSVADAIASTLGALDAPSGAGGSSGASRARRRGAAPAQAPEAAAWRGLAAAWFVATDAGAPLASSLRDFASSLRDLAQTRRELRTALAAPVATARMVMGLPVVGVLFGIVLGLDTLATLFATGPGLVCLGLGLALMLGARAWNRRLVASARPARLTPGLTMDLMAVAVSGGASIPRAVALVAEAGERCGISDDGTDAVIGEVLALSSRAGVPAAALLRSEAEEARRDARSAGERKAATLAVTLMLPLGLCILPAFMLLGVAPLLIAMVSSTVAGL